MTTKTANGYAAWADRPPRERLCVALDVPTEKEALRLVGLLRAEVGWFKVGSQLFAAEGPSVITAIKETGVKVFLDLKYHDIPNTVAGAVESCRSLGVDMLNVHTLGGIEMMEAAITAAKSSNGGPSSADRPWVLGVTLLTSMDQKSLKDELRVESWLRSYVAHLAWMAMKAGLDGVIASPQEASRIRLELGSEPIIVTPGIRPADADMGDQKRTRTPGVAIREGASMLVVGRPITEAPDPKQAAKLLLEEFEGTNTDG